MPFLGLLFSKAHDFQARAEFPATYPNKAALPAQAEWLDARRLEATCWERPTLLSTPAPTRWVFGFLLQVSLNVLSLPLSA